MLTSQRVNPQRSGLLLPPGSHKRRIVRSAKRKPCIRAEAIHPKHIKPDPQDRKDERDMCKRLENNFKQLLDPILEQYEKEAEIKKVQDMPD